MVAPRFVHAVGLATLAAALVDCRACRDRSDTAPDPSVHVSDGSTGAPAPEGSTAFHETSRDARTDASPGEVSLLKTTSARVAVSSLVDNPSASPNDLLDGVDATAWNGKTGDLLGAWIAFRVPAAAQVNAVVLSAGFDGRAPDGGDLFTMNHRITRVRVTRDGAFVREAELDPTVRTPQRVSIGGAGGDYEIEVLATLPGTTQAWREVVVSTFDVLGVPGDATTKGRPTLGVRVGSLAAPAWLARDTLDGVAGLPKPGPWPSLDAYCKRFAQSVEAAAREAGRAVQELVERCPRDAGCAHEPIAYAGAPGPPLQALESVRVCDGTNVTTWLAIQSPRGWFVQADALASDPCVSPNSGGEVKRELVRLERPTAGSPTLLVVQRATSWSPFYGGDQGPKMIRSGARTLHACRFPEGFVDCDKRDDLATWNSADPFEGSDFPPDDHWNAQKTFHVLPDAGIDLRDE